MDVLEPVAIEVDDPRIAEGASDLLRALLAQQDAEDAHSNCPECEESERAWWTCESCSEHYGVAIELRHEALVKVGAMRVVPVEDVTDKEASE